jgi:hypothetical protein
MKMLIAFFHIKGIVHFEFVSHDQRVNQAYWEEMLMWLYELVRRKRPELWPNDCILHYVNAPAHKALSLKQFLAQKSPIAHPIPLI